MRDRRGSLGLRQIDLHERTGLAVATIQDIESAKHTNLRTMTVGALERGLEWEPGSVRNILDGGEPTRPPLRATDLSDPDRGLGVIAASWGKISEHTKRLVLQLVDDELEHLRATERAREDQANDR